MWGVVLGTLATAATLTYFVLSSAPEDPTPAVDTPGQQAQRTRSGIRSGGDARHYSRERFMDAGVSAELPLALRDPQMAASRRSFPELDGGAPASFAPMMRIAHVTEVQGDSVVAVGDRCEIRVLPVQTMDYNCLARVQCGEALLYPDPSQRAGYVACELSEYGFPNHARDANVTGMDGDPALLFDLPRRRVVVRDGGDLGQSFSAVLTIDPLPRLTQRRRLRGDDPS
ncbi:MAG: hypothetical protein GXP55_22320 [Deltaproteobacteria bacterium]|nr:hypothetical protein [Deltaproteobacteria bacterium]